MASDPIASAEQATSDISASQISTATTESFVLADPSATTILPGQAAAPAPAAPQGYGYPTEPVAAPETQYAQPTEPTQQPVAEKHQRQEAAEEEEGAQEEEEGDEDEEAEEVDSLPSIPTSVLSPSEAGSSTSSDAQREWEASLEQLQMLLTMVLVPFAGKFIGRKVAYWSWGRYMEWVYDVDVRVTDKKAFAASGVQAAATL